MTVLGGHSRHSQGNHCREKDKQIRDQWKREAGPQFGMILEVLPSSFFRKRRKEKVA